MKHWTVMMVPHDQGSTRSLNVGTSHFWMIGTLFVILVTAASLFAFFSAYLYQQTQAAQEEFRDLQRANRNLTEQINQQATQTEPELSDRDIQEAERRIREEYEARTRAITAELNDLYVLEGQIREMQGLPPRVTSTAGYTNASADDGNGKGGPPGRGGSGAIPSLDDVLRPPHVIYGLSRPPADLIVQEIRLRIASLTELRNDMRTELDRIQRIPSIWPLEHSRHRVTSRYGYRRDPFNRQVRHHDGIDISAPYGTPVMSTGRGRVISSTYENYYGHVVRVDHGDGVVTLYAHLSSRSVEVGDQVERGDVIGRLGTSGRSTGPHVHYEVKVDGRNVDPEQYLP